MPMDPLPVWLQEWENLPVDATGTQSPKDIANFVDERVTGKLEFGPLAKFTPPPKFTWQKALFESALRILALVPSPDPITPRTAMANAWQTATLASLMGITAPGTTINPPPPPTTGSVLTAVALIDPPTVAVAYAGFLSDLLTAPPATTPAESVFPRACFKAFTQLTFSVTGTDTTPTPAGPLPIVMPLTAVV